MNHITIKLFALTLILVLSPASEVFAQKNKGRSGAKRKILVGKPAAAIQAPQPPAPRANADTNGDGKTDFVIARADGDVTGVALADGRIGSRINRGAVSVRERLQIDKTQPAAAGAMALGIQWWSGNAGIPPVAAQVGDSATDFVIMEDFDGDGKDDFSVWRPGPPDSAKFIIFESSTGAIREEVFGQTGDDPTVSGDYDGDGKADPATFRCPSSAPGQCFFYYRGSLNNPSRSITYIPWGHGLDGDFYANPGDFDGDGKYDFCIQRTAPSTTSVGQFVLLKSSDFGVEYITWGNSADFILPGDYDGDGKADFCVRQTFPDGRYYHWVLTRTGAVMVVQFGMDGDESAPGDYDGDGKQDFAVWREDPINPDNNYFWVRKSSDSGLLTYEWGVAFDYPAANWYVH